MIGSSLTYVKCLFRPKVLVRTYSQSFSRSYKNSNYPSLEQTQNRLVGFLRPVNVEKVSCIKLDIKKDKQPLLAKIDTPKCNLESTILNFSKLS